MGPRGEVEFAIGDARQDYSVGTGANAGSASDRWDLGGAVKVGNDALASALIGAMRAIRADGTLATIFEQYGITYQQPSRLDDRIQVAD